MTKPKPTPPEPRVKPRRNPYMRAAQVRKLSASLATAAYLMIGGRFAECADLLDNIARRVRAEGDRVD